jgi:hypothetical protein
LARPLLTLLLGRVLEKGGESRMAAKAYKRCFATLFGENKGGYAAVFDFESWRTWFSDPRPWLQLGQACAKLGLSFTAAEMIYEGVERDLADPELWIQLARAQSKCGADQLQAAMQSAERAAALDPRHDEYKRATEQLRGRWEQQQAALQLDAGGGVDATAQQQQQYQQEQLQQVQWEQQQALQRQQWAQRQRASG